MLNGSSLIHAGFAWTLGLREEEGGSAFLLKTQFENKQPKDFLQSNSPVGHFY